MDNIYPAFACRSKLTGVVSYFLIAQAAVDFARTKIEIFCRGGSQLYYHDRELDAWMFWN